MVDQPTPTNNEYSAHHWYTRCLYYERLLQSRWTHRPAPTLPHVTRKDLLRPYPESKSARQTVASDGSESSGPFVAASAHWNETLGAESSCCSFIQVSESIRYEWKGTVIQSRMFTLYVNILDWITVPFHSIKDVHVESEIMEWSLSWWHFYELGMGFKCGIVLLRANQFT